MFDLGRPTFLTNGEFCDQPPPYLTRKPAKIEDVLDEDVLEDDEESLTTLSQKMIVVIISSRLKRED